MSHTIKDMAREHAMGVLRVLNHYITTSMAAYFDQPLEQDFFDTRYAQTRSLAALVVCDEDDQVVGVAFVRPMHPAPTFKRTGEWGIFLMPQCCGQQLGPRLLAEAIMRVQARGVDNLMATVSSHNLGSIRFHERLGFEHRGCLYRVGRKFGQDFDLLHMQLTLSA